MTQHHDTTAPRRNRIARLWQGLRNDRYRSAPAAPPAPVECLEPRLLLSADPALAAALAEPEPAAIEVADPTPATSSTVPGDLNIDGFVGAGDLDILLGRWNQNVDPDTPEDLTGDNFIGAGDLDILLGNWNTDGPVELWSGETYTTTIATPTDTDTLLIDAQAGDDLYFVLGDDVSSSFFELSVRLLAPDGTVLAEASSASGMNLDTLGVPQTGTYTYVISEAQADTTGSYSVTAVTIDGVPDSDNVALTSGQTVGADLARGDIDTFTIEGDAGDRLFLNFDDDRSTSFFDLGVFIYNPDGSLLASADDLSSGASFTDLVMTQAGTYTVLVRDLDGNAIGDYALTAVVVDDTVDASNIALTSGETVNADLALGDIDTFTIEGDAGDRLFLNLDDGLSTSFFDLGVFIFNPDGSLLASVDDTTSGASFTDLAMTQAGTYTVVVRDLGGDTTGDYALTAVVIDDVIDADNTELTSGQPAAGELALGDIDTFTLDASAGQSLQVDLTDDLSTSFFDLGVFVFNPDGSLLTSADDRTGGATLLETLSQTGRYTILVRDLGGDTTGTYTLIATLT